MLRVLLQAEAGVIVPDAAVAVEVRSVTLRRRALRQSGAIRSVVLRTHVAAKNEQDAQALLTTIGPIVTTDQLRLELRRQNIDITSTTLDAAPTALFSYPRPPPPSPPSPPPSGGGGGAAMSDNALVALIICLAAVVGGGGTAAYLVYSRINSAKQEIRSASDGASFGEQDYVGEASPHRITSPRFDPDRGGGVELGHARSFPLASGHEPDGRPRLPPIDGRMRLPPLAPSEKLGGDEASGIMRDAPSLEGVEPTPPEASGSMHRRDDLHIDTASASEAASSSHVPGRPEKGWGTPTREAAKPRNPFSRRRLSGGGIVAP